MVRFIQKFENHTVLIFFRIYLLHVAHAYLANVNLFDKLKFQMFSIFKEKETKTKYTINYNDKSWWNINLFSWVYTKTFVFHININMTIAWYLMSKGLFENSINHNILNYSFKKKSFYNQCVSIKCTYLPHLWNT